ncbi:hypothetical protein LTS18_012111, partial [Coniosporium uncinatum]
MVVREPVGNANFVPPPLRQAANNPPYPTSPMIPNSREQPEPSNQPKTDQEREDPKPSSFHLVDVIDAEPPASIEDVDYPDSGSDNWDSDLDDEEDERKNKTPEELPAALRVGQSSRPSLSREEGLPAALRVGPPDGMPIRRSTESERSELEGSSVYSQSTTAAKTPIAFQSHNPYLRMQNTGQTTYAAESSASVWGNMPSQNDNGPAELPAEKTPIDQVANMNLEDKAERDSPPTRQPPLIPVEADLSHHQPERRASESSTVWDSDNDVPSTDAVTSRAPGLAADGQSEPGVQ